MITTTTPIFDRLTDQWGDYEIIICQGGARSGKTHSILQFLLFLAQNSKAPLVISIVAGTLPHLKKGALRQFIEILGDAYNFKMHDRSNHIFRFGNSIIEFFSVDNEDKARGPERDILFVNEANVGVSKKTFEYLDQRTRIGTIVDFNPLTRFYIHDVATQKNASLTISTFRDNPFLAPKIIQAIERLQTTDPESWRVFGLGLIGVYDGLVFNRTRVVKLDKVESIIIKKYFGLDFGFFPDPMAFISAGLIGDDIFIFDEIIKYKFEIEDMAKLIKPIVGDNIVWCDGAEPRSISRLKKCGIKAHKADKRDRQFRIDWCRSHMINISPKCQVVKKEMSLFSRKKDKHGEIIPEFEDGNDHCIDAMSYAFTPIMLHRGNIKNAQIPGI